MNLHRKLLLAFALCVVPALLLAQAPTPQPAGSVAATQQPGPADRQANIDRLMTPAAGPTPEQGLVGVVLSTKDKDVRLEPLPGSMGATYAFVTALIFASFPEKHASVRINDAQPAIHAKIGVNPKGRLYLVKLEVNERTNNRSVKIGHSGFGSFSGMQSPDEKWTVPVTMLQGAPGDWTLTPSAPLVPGEYGLYTGPGAVMNSQPGASGGELYDFGVDPKPQ